MKKNADVGNYSYNPCLNNLFNILGSLLYKFVQVTVLSYNRNSLGHCLNMDGVFIACFIIR